MKVSIRQDETRGWFWVIYPSKRWPGHLIEQGRLRSLTHGWARSNDEALAHAAEAAGTALQQQHSAIAQFLAEEYLNTRRQQRRNRITARNSDKRGSHGIEYLYCVYSGKKFPITKVTCKRVYFRWTADTWRALEPEQQITSVSRDELSRAGRIERGKWYDGIWNTKARTSVMTKEQYEAYCLTRIHPGPSSGFTVRECRRQMQRHHPDKGGNADQFRLWHERFEIARAQHA